jgi:hypothetical protein
MAQRNTGVSAGGRPGDATDFFQQFIGKGREFFRQGSLDTLWGEMHDHDCQET